MNVDMPLIVVVDDDGDTLEVYRRVLETVGFRVSLFVDPEEALEQMRIEPPSVLITDLMMSSVDSGFELSRAVKSDPRLSSLPVIVATAVARRRGFDFRPRSDEDLKAMNIDAFFSKPVDPMALIKAVQALIVSGAQR